MCASVCVGEKGDGGKDVTFSKSIERDFPFELRMEDEKQSFYCDRLFLVQSFFTHNWFWGDI